MSESQHPVVTLAIELATKYHAGQLDKSGRPYLGHLERTAQKVRFSGGTWIQEAAAWLHDSLEDTEATAADLLMAGVPHSVLKIIYAMTHLPHQPNITYWTHIRVDYPDAVLVKLCDIYDNLDPARMCYLDTSSQLRLRRKYAKAINVLCGGV